MTDHPHRHDVWGDDPEERDASAVVEEILAERAGRPWHDHPGIVWVKAVGRFTARNGRRIGITIAGFAVMLAGVVLLVLPGPGWLLIFAGLAILSTEYVWARRLLMTAKRKAEEAKDAVVRRKNGRAERKARRNGLSASNPTDDVA